jgi:hypothetical protein
MLLLPVHLLCLHLSHLPGILQAVLLNLLPLPQPM